MIPLSVAARAYARQPNFSALLLTDVKPPTGQLAACKQAAADDLGRMGLTVLTEHIFFGTPAGRSQRTTMAVAAQVGEVDRWLQSVVSGRPLGGSVMQSAENFGAITLKDGSVKAKVQLLPFDGDEYGVFAFVDTVLLLNEAHCSERLSLTQRLMINPMVREAAGQLASATEAALARHEADSANEALAAIQRSAASKKALHQRDMLDAFRRIGKTPEEYIAVASQPLQNFPCLDALDNAVPLVMRDDGDADARRRRSSLGWAFARDSAIATVLVRKTCQIPADPRAAMMVAQRLLHTPTPPAAGVLRPTGAVADVTLVTPTKVAEGRITAAAVRAKLHLLACDQPWSYDAVASANASNTDQATYTIPHTLADHDAETWATAFRAASSAAGTPVDLIVESDHFSATTLPNYTGPDVHVYSIEDIIVDVNLECVQFVCTDGIEMEFSRADVADATPTNLRRAVEAGSHLPAIIRWSRSQPPGTDPLPWLPETIPAAIPAATLAPGWPGPASGTHAIAYAAMAPAPRFEGLTQTIARVNSIETVLATIAQAQAQTSQSIVHLTASVAALVQHAGIAHALPPTPPPAASPQTYAAIAAGPAPADAVTIASVTDDDMSDTHAAAAAAQAESSAAATSWHGSMTPATTGTPPRTGAAPSAEMDLNDDSEPVPDAAPMSRRARFSAALGLVRPAASGTAQAGGRGSHRVHFSNYATARDAEEAAINAADADAAANGRRSATSTFRRKSAPRSTTNAWGQSGEIKQATWGVRKMRRLAIPHSALPMVGSHQQGDEDEYYDTTDGEHEDDERDEANYIHFDDDDDDGGSGDNDGDGSGGNDEDDGNDDDDDGSDNDDNGDGDGGSGGDISNGGQGCGDGGSGDADGDGSGGSTGDDDDTSQHAGESSDAYETRLSGIIPPSAHFCGRPVFS